MLAVSYTFSERQKMIIGYVKNSYALLDVCNGIFYQVRVIGKLVPVTVINIVQLANLIACEFGLVPIQIVGKIFEYFSVNISSLVFINVAGSTLVPFNDCGIEVSLI